MERGEKLAEKTTEGTNEVPKFRWQVLTEGGFHATLGGKMRIYKPGEVFEATEEEVPLAFRDVIVKVGDAVITKAPEVVPGNKPSFTLVEVEGREDNEEPLFFIVNHTGKRINSVGLPKDKAESFLNDLLA